MGHARQLDPTLRALFRRRRAELREHDKTPPKVVINEYRLPAPSFEGGTSQSFVNAVLDHMARRHARSILICRTV